MYNNIMFYFTVLYLKKSLFSFYNIVKYGRENVGINRFLKHTPAAGKVCQGRTNKGRTDDLEWSEQENTSRGKNDT